MAVIDERIDDKGRLVVRLSEAFELAPKREGWRAWWLNRVATRTPDPQRVTYMREEES